MASANTEEGFSQGIPAAEKPLPVLHIELPVQPTWLSPRAASLHPPQRVLGLLNFTDPAFSLVRLICGIKICGSASQLCRGSGGRARTALSLAH